MAWTFDQLIAEMHVRHQFGQIELGGARTDITAARIKAGTGDYAGAINSLADAVYHNNQAVEDTLASSYYGYDGATNLIPTALDRNMGNEFVTGDEVTIDMKAILDAMWDSLDWQTLLFVTRIDAMRGSISEKTVTEQAMANQLRHFLHL